MYFTVPNYCIRLFTMRSEINFSSFLSCFYMTWQICFVTTLPLCPIVLILYRCCTTLTIAIKYTKPLISRRSVLWWLDI